MVAKTMKADVRVARLIEPLAVAASLHESTLVICIDDSAVLTVETGESVSLEPWDLAVLSQCAGRISSLQPRDSPAVASIFLATLTG